MEDYSTKQISIKLMTDISESLKDMDYGSLELFVSGGEVTQITKRQIRKTNVQRKRENTMPVNINA